MGPWNFFHTPFSFSPLLAMHHKGPAVAMAGALVRFSAGGEANPQQARERSSQHGQVWPRLTETQHEATLRRPAACGGAAGGSARWRGRVPGGAASKTAGEGAGEVKGGAKELTGWSI